jgi:hypothetical protein
MDFLISQNLPRLIGNMPDFQRAMNPNTPVLMNDQGIPRTTETATFINPMPTPFTMSDQFMLAPTITMRDGVLQKMTEDAALDTALQRGAYKGFIPLPGILTPQGLQETEYARRLPGLISDFIAAQRGLR